VASNGSYIMYTADDFYRMRQERLREERKRKEKKKAKEEAPKYIIEGTDGEDKRISQTYYTKSLDKAVEKAVKEIIKGPNYYLVVKRKLANSKPIEMGKIKSIPDFDSGGFVINWVSMNGQKFRIDGDTGRIIPQ